MRCKTPLTTRRIGWTFFLLILLLMLGANPAYSQWATNGNNINNTNSGNVGVGTSSPSSRLTIVGPVQNGVYTVQVDSTAGGQAGSQHGILIIGTSATRYLTAGVTTINGTAPHLNITAADNSNFTSTLGNTGGFGRVLRLRSSSSINIPVMQVEGSNGGAISLSALANGNVGIGTSNATSKLHLISGTDSATSFLSLDTGTHGGTSFTVGGNASNESTFDLSVYRLGAYTSRFGVNNAGNVYLQPAGGTNYVGIGTTNPTSMLHVAGNVTVTGNIAAKYQDVAEWVESSQELTPGVVVVLDSTRSNQVVASTTAYDTRVAGVISEKPGIALGEAGSNKFLVATTGRVRIRVDTSHGPIQVGDLLVTSDKPGTAMKSVPVAIAGVSIHRPGTLIGKALEPLAQGSGEILVLLSLQ
jgi:hypothetical protein